MQCDIGKVIWTAIQVKFNAVRYQQSLMQCDPDKVECSAIQVTFYPV